MINKDGKKDKEETEDSQRQEAAGKGGGLQIRIWLSVRVDSWEESSDSAASDLGCSGTSKGMLELSPIYSSTKMGRPIHPRQIKKHIQVGNGRVIFPMTEITDGVITRAN